MKRDLKKCFRWELGAYILTNVRRWLSRAATIMRKWPLGSVNWVCIFVFGKLMGKKDMRKFRVVTFGGFKGSKCVSCMRIISPLEERVSFH